MPSCVWTISPSTLRESPIECDCNRLSIKGKPTPVFVDQNRYFNVELTVAFKALKRAVVISQSIPLVCFMDIKHSKSVVFFPPGKVEIRDTLLPKMKEGQLLVETLYSAVSPGTEGRCLKGQQSGVGMQACMPGYQAVVKVLKADVSSTFKSGDLVFHYGAEPSPGGLVNFFGTHSKWAVVEECRAIKLGSDKLLASLSMAKLCAVSLHGIELAKINAGERVVVVGLGLLGQLSARIAKLKGAQVIAVDRNPKRVEQVKQAGIDAVVSIGTLSESIDASAEGFDVIIDVTGVPAVLAEACSLGRTLMPWESPVHRGSRYVIQGSYAGDFTLNYDQLFFKELSVLVPRDHTRADLEASIKMIESGTLDLTPLIGEGVDPMDAPSVYAELSDPHSSRLTAVFDWIFI